MTSLPVGRVRASERRGHGFGFAVVGGGMLLIAATAAISYAVPPTVQPLYLATTGVLTGVLALAGYGLRVHGRDFLAPAYIMATAFGFYWVVRGYYLVAEPERVEYYVHRPVVDALAQGQLVTVFALAMFLAGYAAGGALRIARSPVKTADVQPTDGAFVSVALFAALGWAARIVAIQSGSYQKLNVSGAVASSTVAQTLGFLAFTSCATAVVLAYRTTGARWRVAVAVLVAGEVAFAVLTGYKSQLIFLILAVLIARQYGRQRALSPRRIVALFLLGYFVVLPLIQLNRTIQQNLTVGSRATNSAIIDGLTRTPSEYWRHRDQIGSGIFSLRSLMLRTTSVESVALATRYTPALQGYQVGREYLQAIPNAIVPSVFWPGKPKLGLAGDFTETYALAPYGRGSLVGPSLTGDLYMNFGLPGVAVGWFLLGSFLRALYRQLIQSAQPTVTGILIYATVLLAVTPAIEATVSRLEVGLIQMVPLTALVVFVTRRLGRKWL